MNDMSAVLAAAGEPLDRPEPARPTLLDLHAVLVERGRNHGEFRDHAATTQALKDTLRNSLRWPEMSAIEREAAEMIVHKLGRVCAGDPHFKDHWIDIAGYAQLVADRLA